MNDSILTGKRHIHFIGIGGSGMFPLAQILHDRGYFLTGSDNNPSSIVEMERALGIPVVIGQKAENIAGADLIVYTAAVLADNPELLAAKASGVPLLERADLLGLINNSFSDSVCVSGTHGKTSTTSMLTQILLHAGVDPSAVIGGKLKSIGAYGRVGKSDVIVTEACEFKDHFLKLSPAYAVILNIDCDHMEYFKTLDNMKRSFETFAGGAAKAVFVNGDDQNTMEVASRLSGKRVVTFGRGEQNDYRVTGGRALTGTRQCFTLSRRGEELGEITLLIPGAHNQVNAAAAAAVAMELGVSFDDCKAGLLTFTGSGRRFEVLAEVGGVTVVDDYAHHPTEIAATLTAAKTLSFRRVWAVHQPFTYSRTQLLLNDFARALSIADKVTLTEIMGSREKAEDFSVCAADLAAKIPGAEVFGDFDALAEAVAREAKAGDLIITLGCGDVYKAAAKIIALLG